MIPDKGPPHAASGGGRRAGGDGRSCKHLAVFHGAWRARESAKFNAICNVVIPMQHKINGYLLIL